MSDGKFYARVKGGRKEYGISLGSLDDPDSRISLVLKSVSAEKWVSKSEITKELREKGNENLARSDRVKASMDILEKKALVKAKKPETSGKGTPDRLYVRLEPPQEKA